MNSPLPLPREIERAKGGTSEPYNTEDRRKAAVLKTGALQNAILNSANFSSIATDERGVIQIFNVGAERMLGYAAADVVNKITPADISDPQEVIARAQALSLELATTISPGFEALVFKASRGIEDIYELTYIRKDGSRFPAIVSVTALRDERKGIIGYLLIGTDNSARKRAEAALLKAGALQSAIFNSANFSSIATDEKGVIQIFNVGAERMLGYAAADVINKITPADISDPQEVIDRAQALSLELATTISPGFEALVFKASRGIEDIYELTYIRKDGTSFPAVVSVTALRASDGGIIGYLLIGTDNTARKQVDEERLKLDQRLRDQQFYTRSLIESNVDALITTDPLGIITDVNKQTEALTGCTRDELIGAPFKNYFTEPQRAGAAIKQVLGGRKVTNYELTARARDGKETLVSYNATTFYDRDRRLQGVFAAARDITERKHFEQALQQSNAELESAKYVAEKANLAKSDFLSSMSHELRSPLNAILGFAQLMESSEPAPTAAQTARITQILHAGWHLLKLINEILDLAVIESGQMSLSQESVSLSQVMSECQAMMESQAQERGIHMTFPRFENPVFVRADMTRLKQIVINLLSNAIKYNREQGTVIVDCAVGAPGRIRISVRDTGAGLPPEKLGQLFQPFNRLGQEMSGVTGTGIGLVVTKRLAELMEGVLGVESTVGVGSIFWCELTAAAAPQLKAHAGDKGTPGPTAPGARRGAAHPALCRGQPGEHGAGRTTHRPVPGHPDADGDQRHAGHRAGPERAAHGDPDGHQPARHEWNQGLEGSAGRPADHAYSGGGAERQCDAARHREGHRGRIFPLPHQANQSERLHGHAERRAGIRGEKARPRPLAEPFHDQSGGHPERSILIVDDQEANVAVLEQMLHGAGYTSVASTRDPHAVCALHRQHHYDLILLDLQMPGLDGFQVMEELKKIETGGYLPVLVITAQPDLKVRALKAGAGILSASRSTSRRSWRGCTTCSRSACSTGTRPLRSLARLETSQRIASLGDWDHDLTTGVLLWSEEVYRILGIAPKDFPPKSETFYRQVHPDDLAFVHREKKAAATGMRRVDFEHRLIRADGELRYAFTRSPAMVLDMTRAGRCGNPAPSRTSRSASGPENTTRRQSEERYRLMFEQNPTPMWVFDPKTLEFLAVNDATVALYGYSREEFLRLTARDIRPPEANADFSSPHRGLRRPRSVRWTGPSTGKRMARFSRWISLPTASTLPAAPPAWCWPSTARRRNRPPART